MLVRDGRNQVHDLGARRTFSPSLMKPIIGYTDEPGGWTNHSQHRIFMSHQRNPDEPRKQGLLPQHTFQCELCGKTVTRSVFAKFCAGNCRFLFNQRAKRQRDREALRTP